MAPRFAQSQAVHGCADVEEDGKSRCYEGRPGKPGGLLRFAGQLKGSEARCKRVAPRGSGSSSLSSGSAEEVEIEPLSFRERRLVVWAPGFYPVTVEVRLLSLPWIEETAGCTPQGRDLTLTQDVQGSIPWQPIRDRLMAGRLTLTQAIGVRPSVPESGL